MPPFWPHEILNPRPVEIQVSQPEEEKKYLRVWDAIFKPGNTFLPLITAKQLLLLVLGSDILSIYNNTRENKQAYIGLLVYNICRGPLEGEIYLRSLEGETLLEVQSEFLKSVQPYHKEEADELLLIHQNIKLGAPQLMGLGDCVFSEPLKLFTRCTSGKVSSVYLPWATTEFSVSSSYTYKIIGEDRILGLGYDTFHTFWIGTPDGFLHIHKWSDKEEVITNNRKMLEFLIRNDSKLNNFSKYVLPQSDIRNWKFKKL